MLDLIFVLIVRAVVMLVVFGVICFAIGWAVTFVVVPVRWLVQRVARANRNDYHADCQSDPSSR